MDPQNVVLENLAVIDRIIAGLCRRHALVGDTADDFASWVREKLIDDDYRVVRSFQGRSSFSTFLVVVITNLLRDYNVQRWGRWRASAEAKRIGPVAIQLETLLYRDGYSFAEACSVLQNRGTDVSRRELAVIATRVPARIRQREVGDEGLEYAPANGSGHDPAAAVEAREHRSDIVAKMERAIAQLDAEDQLLVRMRFWEGLSVADVARALHIEQKPLYRRLDRALAAVKAGLADAGVDEAVVADMLQDIEA